jgi:hypothetical protein
MMLHSPRLFYLFYFSNKKDLKFDVLNDMLCFYFLLFCFVLFHLAFLLKLACLVVLLLVINTTDVVDIVLNFTAVNFISAFDDVGKKKMLGSCRMELKLSI